MKKKDIEETLKTRKRFWEVFGNQFDQPNNASNQAIKALQQEMARPNSATRQAIEALKQDLNTPNNATHGAMRMLQREMDRPSNAASEAMKAIKEFELPRNFALESIREFQKQMMLPNDRMKKLSRSMAEVSSQLALNKDLMRGLSSAIAPTFVAVRNVASQLAFDQVDQVSKIAADIGRRQAELLATSWSPAVFPSTLRTPEIASMIEGVTSLFVRNNAAALGSLSRNVFESIRQNEAFTNFEFLRKTHFADLAARVVQAVESSGNEEELAANITAIVEESLEKPDKSRFTTFERISIAFMIVTFILGVYAAVFTTLQYMDLQRPQPVPVIKIDFLRNFQRDFLERYVPFLLKDEIEVEYFIERDVPLMSAPRWRSSRLGKALAGSRALLFERNHKWIFAEVFHPTEDTSQFGWFNKKYSKRVI